MLERLRKNNQVAKIGSWGTFPFEPFLLLCKRPALGSPGASFLLHGTLIRFFFFAVFFSACSTRNHVRISYRPINQAQPENLPTLSEKFPPFPIRQEQIKKQRSFSKKRRRRKTASFIAPLRITKITSPFGRRHRHPVNGGKGKLHKGVDLRAGIGTPIFAVADGLVLSSSHERHYGWLLAIRHANGVTSRYAHLSRIFVRRGSRVRKGDRIALSGNSGRTTGPHLHFEIWKNGGAVNPVNYIHFYRR